MNRKYTTKHAQIIENLSTLYKLDYISVSAVCYNKDIAFSIKNISFEQLLTKKVDKEIESIKEYLKSMFTFLEQDLDKVTFTKFFKESPFIIKHISIDSEKWRIDFENIEYGFLKLEHQNLHKIYNYLNQLINEC